MTGIELRALYIEEILRKNRVIRYSIYRVRLSKGDIDLRSSK